MKLYLIRGLPGSGKSTIAASLSGFRHLEADMYFMKDGAYKFDPKKIKDAHAWCRDQAFNAFMSGFNVVVANTFTTHKEMEPYFEIARHFNVRPAVFIATGEFGSIHNVPADVISRMQDRWEP